ncbi:MAG TPA: hypothetical protein PK668_27995 [Myxococcota bacterium]|nr:hypothetical protein [Myxococcota bacterium]HRY97340.1 hypothetical protein [Myxococcota bacterium]
MRIWVAEFVVVMFGLWLAACDSGSAVDPDGGVDADSADGSSVEDDGSSVEDDGSSVEDDGGSVEDDGSSVDDDGEPAIAQLWKISQTYFPLARELIGVAKSNSGSPAVFLGWRSIPGDTAQTVFDVRRSSTFVEGRCAEYSSIATSPVNSYLDTTVGAGSVYYYCVAIGAEYSNVVTVDTSSLVDRDAARFTLPFAGCSNGSLKQVTNAVVSDLNGDSLLDFAIGYCDFVGDNPIAYCENQPMFVVGMLRQPTGDWQQAWCFDANHVAWKATTDWPMVAWDADGDGKAEIFTRTDNGQNMTVLDGETGSVRAQLAWPVVSPDTKRNYAAIAYLDGITPSLILQRGLYGQVGQPHMYAYSFVDGGYSLEHEFVFNQDPLVNPDSMGTHGLPTADLDGEGIDEIIVCGAILELRDGELVLRAPPFSTDNSDACIPDDVRPDLEGLEIFFGEEGGLNSRAALADRSGTLLWSHKAGVGTYNGLPIEYRNGWEAATCFYKGGEDGLVCQLNEFCEGTCMTDQGFPAGETASNPHRFSGLGAQLTANRRDRQMDWLLGEGIIGPDEEFNNPPGVTFDGGAAGYALGDVFGDSRAEVLTFSTGALWIYTNTAPISTRYITQLADPNYFKTLAREGSGYASTFKPAATRTFALLCRANASRLAGECVVSSLADFEDDIQVSCVNLSGGEPCGIANPAFALERNSSVITSISFPAAGRFQITANCSSAQQVIKKGVVLDLEH